jgi:hypothetical protein
MRAGPEPVVTIIYYMGERPIPVADAHRPESSDSLEGERGVSRVCLEQSEVLVPGGSDVQLKGLV